MGSELTKEESAWIRKVQRALDSCPSSRLGFYTIGDHDIIIYDKDKDEQIDSHMDNQNRSDFCSAVDGAQATLGRLDFPSHVHSTAG